MGREIGQTVYAYVPRSKSADTGMHDRREELEQRLTLLLAGLFVVSLLIVIILAMFPQASTDPHTEFYLLGTDGNASGYPTNLSVGETGTFIVGVVNNEQRQTAYTVRLELENDTVAERTLTLEDGERWEEPFSFALESEGRYRLWVRLYLGDGGTQPSDPYDELWLWIDVHR